MGTNARLEDEASWLQIITIGRNPRRTFIRILILAMTCFIVSKYMLLPIHVEGGSMLPTYKNGINFVNRLTYLFRQPRRGDVVTVRYAGPSIMLMKRIVGLPGESVGFHRGYVVVNGKLLSEPYRQLESDWERDSVTLGPDEYFVVGDNRSMPQADHTFGIAPRNRIVGNVLL